MSLKKLSKCLLIFIALLITSQAIGQEVRESKAHSYNSYIGKPLAEILNNCSGKILDKVFLEEPPAVLIGVAIHLNDDTLITVYFRRLKYVTAYNQKRNWGWDEVGKEKIGRIHVKNLSKE